jgi:hypothetical protein
MLRWLQHGTNIAHICSPVQNMPCFDRTNDLARWYSFPSWVESACPRPQQTGAVILQGWDMMRNMFAAIVPERNWQHASFRSRNKWVRSHGNTYWSPCINLNFLLRQCSCPQSTPWWKGREMSLVFSRFKNIFAKSKTQYILHNFLAWSCQDLNLQWNVGFRKYSPAGCYWLFLCSSLSEVNFRKCY